MRQIRFLRLHCHAADRTVLSRQSSEPWGLALSLTTSRRATQDWGPGEWAMKHSTRRSRRGQPEQTSAVMRYQADDRRNAENAFLVMGLSPQVQRPTAARFVTRDYESPT